MVPVLVLKAFSIIRTMFGEDRLGHEPLSLSRFPGLEPLNRTSILSEVIRKVRRPQ